MQVGIDMGAVAGSGSASAAALGGGKQAMLDLEELLATRLLVQGNSGSGKSHLLRRLLEQSAQWVQQCIVDPEGDFVTLADLYGHVVVDAARTEAELTRIAGRIRQHRVSVVLNLEGLDVEQQMRSAAAFLAVCSMPSATIGIRCWWLWMRRSFLRLPPPVKCRMKRASCRSAR